MVRTDKDPIKPFEDPEKAIRRARAARKQDEELAADSLEVEEEVTQTETTTPPQMAARRITLGEIGAPTEATVRRGIVLPTIAADYQIKPSLCNMIKADAFHGFDTEDPHQHLRQFLKNCTTTNFAGIPNDVKHMMLFPFSLKGRAAIWLDKEPAITEWEDCKRKFLKKFFPFEKTARLRANIMKFKQMSGESFSDAWERFNELLDECPHHGIDLPIQLQTFYAALNEGTQGTVDSTAGGSIYKKTAEETLQIFKDLSEHKSKGYASQEDGKEESDQMIFLAAQIEGLTKKIDFIAGKTRCTVCGKMGHVREDCMAIGLFSEKSSEDAQYVEGRGYNYPNTFDDGWRNQGQLFAQPTPPPQKPQVDLEDMMAKLIANTAQFQSSTENRFQVVELSMRNLEAKIDKISERLLASENNDHNPKEQVMEIKLRSGKQLQNSDSTLKKSSSSAQAEPNSVHSPTELGNTKGNEPNSAQGEEFSQYNPSSAHAAPNSVHAHTKLGTFGANEQQLKAQSEIEPAAENQPEQRKLFPNDPPPYVPPLPFPQRQQKHKLDKQFAKFIELFKKLHINIPFADALAQMPSYSKFMKEILSKKRKLGDYETVPLTEECSAIIQRKLPPKLKDPGSFTIPCTFGSNYSTRALCDLGASINLMP